METSLIHQLLLSPQSGNDSNQKSLDVQLTSFLFQNGTLQTQHLLELNNDFPLWISFIQKSTTPLDASRLIFHHLQHIHFDWMSIITDPQTQTSKAALEYFFPYAPLDILKDIFQKISPNDVQQLQHSHHLIGTNILTALNFKRLDLADLLLTSGWNLELTDPTGATPLLKAKNWEVAHQLLKYGANPYASNLEKTTIFDKIPSWATQSFRSIDQSTQILKEIKPFLKKNQTQQDEAIQNLFNILAIEKTTMLKRYWNSLQKFKPNPEGLTNFSQQNFVCLAVQNFLSKDLNKNFFNSSKNIFFLSLVEFLLDVSKPQTWIDLDKPLPYPQVSLWTERDHLFMAIIILKSNNLLSPPLSSHLSQHLLTWVQQRFFAILPELDNWLSQFVQPHSNPNYKNTLSCFFTDPFNIVRPDPILSPFKNQIFSLPIDNPFISKNMEKIIHNWTDFNQHHQWKYQSSYEKWFLKWIQHHSISTNHPLYHSLTMFFFHTISNGIQYNSLSSIIKKNPYFKDIIDQNIHLQPIYRPLIDSWLTFIQTPQKSQTLSLYDLSKPHMDDITHQFFDKLLLTSALSHTPNEHQNQNITTIHKKI